MLGFLITLVDSYLTEFRFFGLLLAVFYGKKRIISEGYFKQSSEPDYPVKYWKCITKQQQNFSVIFSVAGKRASFQLRTAIKPFWPHIFIVL